jgi:lysophospholipase L1-like esterase
LVFFGDSITWHWTLGGKQGEKVWNRDYAGYKPINMGNSGDITPVMLFRTIHGNLDFPAGEEPKVAVLLCGTNNFVVSQSAGGAVQWELGADCPPKDVAAGARAIAQVFRRRLPTTRVIMLGILPVANPMKWPKCQQVNAINGTHSTNKDEVIFLDLQDHFLRPDGSLNKSLFSDGTHPTEEGYEVWAKAMDPLLTEMMNAAPLDPIKIMLIGDGVTAGVNSTESYRRYLDGMLRREGMLIDFRGSQKTHQNQVAPDSYEFDVDHEGHWGENSHWLAKNMPALLQGQRPDVVVLHVGTEDLVTSNMLVDEIIQNVGQIVADLRENNPRVKIILSKVFPVQSHATEVASLNTRIEGYAKSNSSSQSPMIIAELPDKFDPQTDFSKNGRLPSATGAQKLARSIADAVVIAVGEAKE